MLTIAQRIANLISILRDVLDYIESGGSDPEYLLDELNFIMDELVNFKGRN